VTSGQLHLDRELIIGVTPGARPDGRLVVALCRAGALGVLDAGRDPRRARAEMALVEARYDGSFGVRLGPAAGLTPDDLPRAVDTVVVAGSGLVGRHRAAGRRVLAEATSLAEARAALDVGADGIVARGAETGGRVGEETAFVLLQRLVSAVDAPVWLQGGIGLDTAAAAVAGGASGVVLDAQLALTRDATLPPDVRAAVGAMDGSETVVVGGHRVFTRPDLDLPAADTPADEVVARLGADDLRTQLLPVGQDGSFARPLADRYKTAGGIVGALRTSIADHIAAARELRPLAPGAGTAASRGTRHPIAQGPMTRVSDRAGFAAAVADGGALPFLALSLMRADEIRTLLAETSAAVGDRPWGVGILGFVPPELREEQLAVVRDLRPPVALIAGGRPSQAAPLEAEGITTFLHVPSPGLLDRFWKDGARRFVFEGRECGGHVGPRSSFALWQRQIDRLLEERDLAGVEVFFAGGVHDARSSAMVAAMAAPLASRGAAVGVLMGTAYVMTSEAVGTGAVTQTFLDEAVACADTVLLETSPGHATRCTASEYVAAFERRKAELVAAGTDVRAMWTELEGLNLGRLRIAAKGLVREGDAVTEVGDDVRRREGMFMIGQVAALRDAPTTIAELHRDVSEGATALLDAVAVPTAERREHVGPMGIAVIGTAALFPGAVGIDQFWANVVEGADGISEVPAHRWNVDRYYDPEAVVRDAGAKTPSKWGGFLPDVPFDPMRYGIPPRSVTSIGNDQLLSLEVAAAALADAGYADRPFDRARTSVVFGAETGTDLAQAYGFRAALPHFVGDVPAELAAIPQLTEDSFPGVLANVIAGRIANRLDLGGANYTVDAACGASMAALSAACGELTSGASDMVLCGGTDLHNGIYDYLLFAATHALSPTGRCRTFDASADGISLGEGVGCIVLKRVADAERDGDRILAVVDAVSASSDGRSLGLTAPRPEGQRRALERAYDRSGVSPAAVGLVEAHGTGTVVGDRTELATLTEVYSERGAVPGSTTLGSVKSQIGHTKCAAGIAGMIKAVHALHRGVLPPTLNLEEPNEAYDAKTSPFVFGDVARPWVGDDRRAAVSAFGFGGSNFHAVLSAYGGADEPAHGLDQWPAELVLVGGDSPADATAELDRLAGLLDVNEAAGRPWRLRDLARTQHERRRRAVVQVAIVADDLDDLAAKVARARAGEAGRGILTRGAAATSDDQAADVGPQVAFLYPGQGSQRPHMLGDLFVAFPALRRWLALGDGELVERMFPPAAFGEAAGQSAAALTDTRVAQPALGLAGLAMTDLLGRCGVVPAAAGGHSYGELPALVAAGALEAEDLVVLSRARGEAILEASPDDDPGAMAAVRGPVDDVRGALDAWPEVIVANDNAPDQCVISGPTAQVAEASARLAELGHGTRRLPVACAFHTPRLQVAADALAAHLGDLEVGVPRFPVWSNTTAAPYHGDAGEVRARLAGQVAAPVAFRQQIESMYEAGVRVFVESGPGRVLTQLVAKILGDRPHTAVACDAPGDHGIRRFLQALAELAAAGVPVDASSLFEGRDARTVDAAAVPARPPYLLDGSRVRTADGERVPGSLPAAHEFPPITLAAGPAAPATSGGDPQVLVAEYLRGMQQIVAAERDVVLAALGAPPSSSALVVEAPAIDVASAPRPGLGANGHGHDARAVNGAGPVGAAPAPLAGAAVLTAEALLETVVAIVSERTGYPVEMLDPDLDLEAELSIDSIKRIEILGELAERVGLPGMDESGVDESVIEELALIKTLRGIVDWVEDHRDLAPAGEPAAIGATGATGPTARPIASTRPLVRYVPAVVDLPEVDPVRDLAGASVVVVDGGSAVGERLHDVLAGLGATARRVGPADAVGAVGPGVDTLVDLTALPAGGVPTAADPSSAEVTAAIVGPFERLRAASQAGATRMLVVTGQGGHLGHGAAAGGLGASTVAAGVQGVIRTFARELTAVETRLVDVDPAAGADEVVRHLLDELRAVAAPIEVGRDGRGRRTLSTVARPLDADAGTEAGIGEDRDLGPGSVVVVTGGARGIGARLAVELARTTGCGVELVGRSPLPGPEATDLCSAADEVAVRQAIIRRGEHERPAEIEAATARALADREIRTTLAAVAEHAAFVGYRSLDVRDTAALAAALDEVRHERGRLDGVIHAAGVREDKLIRDKTPESFARVFDTKVGAAEVIVEAVGERGFALLFASVSGWFGNAGQVDYAAANSALDGIARRVRAGAPGKTVVAVDWGPWAGTGMVSAELAREYERRGIGLIDPEAGVAAALAELRAGGPEPQVVVMCAMPDVFVQHGA
jgi:acyl transferase domain-containing protein/NAD(P)H-dependent flavin oxidoreductase YrpB (nitropropane dioxygenase family)/NAD(P)-dependent dehydrogenase (short-subunit alcohol dehydrogenase family)